MSIHTSLLASYPDLIYQTGFDTAPANWSTGDSAGDVNLTAVYGAFAGSPTTTYLSSWEGAGGYFVYADLASLLPNTSSTTSTCLNKTYVFYFRTSGIGTNLCDFIIGADSNGATNAGVRFDGRNGQGVSAPVQQSDWLSRFSTTGTVMFSQASAVSYNTWHLAKVNIDSSGAQTIWLDGVNLGTTQNVTTSSYLGSYIGFRCDINTATNSQLNSLQIFNGIC